jgi:hypothetical protein
MAKYRERKSESTRLYVPLLRQLYCIVLFQMIIRTTVANVTQLKA